MLRLGALGFIVLSVIYVVLSLRTRAAYRRGLREEWDEDKPTPDRDAYVREGMKAYDDSIRPKLILGVYIIPVCIVILMIYLVNFY